jgi:hypothetical protein
MAHAVRRPALHLPLVLLSDINDVADTLDGGILAPPEVHSAKNFSLTSALIGAE